MPTPPLSPKLLSQKRRRVAAVLAEASLARPSRPYRAKLSVSRSVPRPRSPSSSRSASSSDDGSDDAAEPTDTVHTAPAISPSSAEDIGSRFDPATLHAWKSFADSLYPCDDSMLDVCFDSIFAFCDGSDADFETSSDVSSVSSESYLASLSQADRERSYAWLNSILPPATGVQENVGSYRAYMARQHHLYFQSILSDAPRPNLDHLRTPSVNAFRGWIKHSGSFVQKKPVSMSSAALPHESKGDLYGGGIASSNPSIQVLHPASQPAPITLVTVPLPTVPVNDGSRAGISQLSQAMSFVNLPMRSDSMQNIKAGWAIHSGVMGQTSGSRRVEGHSGETIGRHETLLPSGSFNKVRTYSANGHL